MPDFAEKARTWPKIASAAELAPLLRNVKPQRYRHYRYAADPPGHEIASKASFQFGDHPQGGLVVTCWACNGPGWFDRLEDLLGAALQIRYSNGSLRYREPGETARAKPPAPEPRPAPGPAGIHHREAALRDLQQAPMWIAARGNAPWQGLALDQGRLADQAYWQSMDDLEAPGGDGLAFARYGGVAAVIRPSGETAAIRIRPWAPLPEIREFIAWLNFREPARPAIALAGSPKTSSPMSLLAIDCDYHPENDPDGAGAQARLRLRKLCAAEGAPVFASSGGHGFHASFLLAPEANPSSPRHRRAGAPKAQGICAETFLSGSRRMLSVRLDKPLANSGDAARMPLITAGQSEDLIKTAFSG